MIALYFHAHKPIPTSEPVKTGTDQLLADCIKKGAEDDFP
jgi:hypothetical protein